MFGVSVCVCVRSESMCVFFLSSVGGVARQALGRFLDQTKANARQILVIYLAQDWFRLLILPLLLFWVLAV